ncbi:MAG: single-stranded-DNA-specific exonuclease RecJ [Alphaproteobacteria bacterium]|nr:single-stranded-DNA-specific exonuclease RecJ [Alphaproteobacteria bacterium]
MIADTGAFAFEVRRSLSGRPWSWAARDEERERDIGRLAKVSPALAQLLSARGVRADAVEAYLHPTLRAWLPEPLLFKDMERAIARARLALERQEQIAVFGDYDVDGSASTAMLSWFFEQLGTKSRLYIPDRRTEGYGPSVRAFEILRQEGAGLAITVDCGAASHEAHAAAARNGLDVIVLDHHAVERGLDVIAHVNPNQPEDRSGHGHLCAAGVAFVFLVGLNRLLRDSDFYGRKGVAEPDLRALLDLVALATICDVVPLTGVNRAFVRLGLARLSTMPRPGLAALAEVAGAAAPFHTQHLGFAFGPRINAGGRVGDCGLGTELLATTDAARANEIATLLDLHNKERQGLEKQIIEEAIGLARSQENAPFVFVAREGWHPGVVGIVAGRLKDRTGKPAFVVGLEGGQGRGSARSIAGVDVGAAVRAAYAGGLIDGGGGHAMAAGFSLSQAQLDGFQTFLAERCASISKEIAAGLNLTIEASVSPAAATPALVDEVARVGPFGAGNPEPNLVVPGVQLAQADVVGNDHVRLRLRSDAGPWLDAIAFRTARTDLGNALMASRGRRIHAAGKLRAEEWQGQRRVQLQLEDAALADV